MNTRIPLLSLAVLCLTVRSLAQSETPPAAEPAKTDAVTMQAAQPAKTDATTGQTQPAAPTPANVSRDKDTLTVDFPDEDIKTILRNVADLFELNLVVPDTLTGKTSIKLRDVTWRQIFHVVLTPAGYNYVEEGNIIKIVSNDSLQQEPATTEVFVLNNAKASDIKPTIDGLVDAATGGKILIDARSNALVVTERPSRIGRIKNIIAQLDNATDQVMIEAKFVEVSSESVHNLGVNWQSLAGYNVSAGPFSSNYNRLQSNNPVLRNTANNAEVPFIQQSNGNAAQAVTNPPPPVSYGVQPNPGPIGGTSNLVQTLNELTTHNASAVFSAPEFNVVLSALNTLAGTKIVSNPTVVTLNNAEAVLNIGTEYPIPNYTYNQEHGSFEVSGFTYKDIGVNLKVTPQVNARGTIKLTLEPEVSQHSGDSSFGGSGGATVPIISTRKVKTQVSLKSGYTAGIGGLIITQKIHSTSSVPVLGSIPGLGRLFSSKGDDNQQNNLLVFITARTLSADGAAPEDVFDPHAVQTLGLGKEEILPGQRGAKGSDIYEKPADTEKK
jgi:type IV pilus assembly protein PilQ